MGFSFLFGEFSQLLLNLKGKFLYFSVVPGKDRELGRRRWR
jgi:hypothetical protein